MLRNLNKSSGGRRILGVPNVGIIASQIISETATGDNGEGLLYNEALANSGKQLRLHITAAPSAGTFFAYENGSLELAGAPDGSYTIGYQYYVDNVLGGSDTATVQVGVVNGLASGGTGTSTGTGSGGAATGGTGTSGTAAGGTGTGAGTGSGGGVNGNANASGLTLTQADIDAIAAATVAAFRAATPLIPVDAREMNGAPIIGTGTPTNKWRGNV